MASEPDGRIVVRLPDPGSSQPAPEEPVDPLDLTSKALREYAHMAGNEVRSTLGMPAIEDQPLDYRASDVRPQQRIQAERHSQYALGQMLRLIGASRIADAELVGVYLSPSLQNQVTFPDENLGFRAEFFSGEEFPRGLDTLVTAGTARVELQGELTKYASLVLEGEEPEVGEVIVSPGGRDHRIFGIPITLSEGPLKKETIGALVFASTTDNGQMRADEVKSLYGPLIKQAASHYIQMRDQSIGVLEARQ